MKFKTDNETILVVQNKQTTKGFEGREVGVKTEAHPRGVFKEGGHAVLSGKCR